jgi:hypothetical protein
VKITIETIPASERSSHYTRRLRLNNFFQDLSENAFNDLARAVRAAQGKPSKSTVVTVTLTSAQEAGKSRVATLLNSFAFRSALLAEGVTLKIVEKQS